MNLKSCVTKRSWPVSKYYLSICLEGLRKPTETLNWGNCYSSRDSNWTPLECNSKELLSEPTCSVGDILKFLWNLKCTFLMPLIGAYLYMVVQLFACVNDRSYHTVSRGYAGRSIYIERFIPSTTGLGFSNSKF